MLGRVEPDRATPSSTAVTAGTAPADADRRLAALQRLGVVRRGSPRLEKIVDSIATTGRPCSRAAPTSGATTTLTCSRLVLVLVLRSWRPAR